MHELDYSSGNSVQRVIRSARTATLRAAYDSPGVTSGPAAVLKCSPFEDQMHGSGIFRRVLLYGSSQL